MERCTFCGSELPDPAQFCGYCGHVKTFTPGAQAAIPGYSTVVMEEDQDADSEPPHLLSGAEENQDADSEPPHLLSGVEENEFAPVRHTPQPDFPSYIGPGSLAYADTLITNTPASLNRPGAKGGSYALTTLITTIVCFIIIGSIGGLFFAVPPAISLSSGSEVAPGGVLHLHGDHFFPGNNITLTLDEGLPLFSAGSRAGEARSISPSALQMGLVEQFVTPNTVIKADGSGSFDVIIPVNPAWGPGSHTIRATEGISARSAVLNFTVEAPKARILVRPSSLDFGQLEVGNMAILSVVVNNSGEQPLNWKASTGSATWLKLAPGGGALQAGASAQFVYVTGDATQLKVGSYTATLTISSNGGNAQINVNLEVVPRSQKARATILVTPEALDFGTLNVGQQLTKAVSVSNSGNLALNWKANLGDANWVSLDSSSQTISPGGLPDTINVTVDTTNLTAGSQSATLTFSSNGGNRQIAINVIVVQPIQTPPQQPCTLQAPSSSNESFTANMGSNPPAQTFTIAIAGSCSGGVIITPTVTMAAGENWLSVTPPSATITSGNTTFTVNVKSSALSPGAYSGTISLAATSGNTAINANPQAIGVALTVAEVPPVLVVSPSSLTFNVSNGDQPTAQPFAISNTGGASLNWTATLNAKAPTYVTLSKGAGTNLAAGTNTGDNINVDPSGAGAGTYAATVTVSATDSLTGKAVSGSPTTISITVNIMAQPAMQLSTTSLKLTPATCANAASNTITLKNSGDGTLSWTVGNPTYPSGSPTGWLSVSPGQGSGDATLAFTVNESLLASGQTYTAAVTITPSAGKPQTISVSFTENCTG